MDVEMRPAVVKPPFLTLTVPIDPSYDVNRAIDDAIALAAGETTLHFCSVVDAAATTASGATGAIIDPTPMIEGLEERAVSVCDEAVAKATAHGLAADREVLFGSRTAELIADVARRNGSEAILIHTHGRQGIPLLVAGSVAEDLLRAAGVAVEIETLHGAAGRAIADGARREKSVLIIMGTHGRSGIARAALGSVAASVIKDARLPVMVVRQPGT